MGDKQIRFENKQGAIRIFINDGIEQSIDVTREIADLLQAERSKTIDECIGMIKLATVTEDDVNQVVLEGGSRKSCETYKNDINCVLDDLIAKLGSIEE